MADREMGIEEARMPLGDLVLAAQQHGAITYLTRYGKPAAAIVPLDIIPAERLKQAPAAAGRKDARGLIPRATAERECHICSKGIYACGHDDAGKPLWLHVDGYRYCDEREDSVASPF